MKVVIAGGSGFLGRALESHLISAGHRVVILSRHSGGIPWQPDGTADAAWAREIDGAGAVVNLAGAGIADKRWTARRKQILRQSRILSTRSLVAAIRAAARKPDVFLSASAVGYYGDPDDRPVDESSPPGTDFLAALCVEWEAEARAAEGLGCRTVIVRAGLVLDRRGGALKRMIPPFLFFVGGPIASGRQVVSWIHRDDWIALVRWALERPEVSGPINGTAPGPVTSREFSHALGRALHRPSWFAVPAFVLKILFGEMADVTLVDGQRVLPTRALEQGFVFRYPDIDAAMQAAISPPA